MRKCFQEFKERRPQFRHRGSLLAYELLLELSRNIRRQSGSLLVSRAVELMEHHLSQPLSLKKLASQLGTSPTSLHREFQNTLQTSPINYFLHLKMETAKSLLRNTNLQIQEIAASLGYENALYFSSEFKKRVGLSPRHFKNQPNQPKGSWNA